MLPALLPQLAEQEAIAVSEQCNLTSACLEQGMTLIEIVTERCSTPISTAVTGNVDVGG